MVGAVLIGLRELQNRPCQIIGKRRTPVLIRDHTDTAGFTGFPKNRFDEVLAVKAVEPSGADDEVLGADRAHEDFARPFGATIGVDGADGVSFFAKREIGAGENVVGGDVQQRAALADDVFSEVLRAQSVYFKSMVLIDFNVIDSGHRSGIDNK